MNTVIPIRPHTPTGPAFRHDTVNDLFTGDRIPAVGDFVSRVSIQNDTNGFALWTPAFGVLRAVDTHTAAEHPSITLRFDFGSAVTVSGDAELTWAPNES